jgi:hypothetical protein
VASRFSNQLLRPVPTPGVAHPERQVHSGAVLADSSHSGHDDANRGVPPLRSEVSHRMTPSLMLASLRRPLLAAGLAIGALALPLPILHAAALAADPGASPAVTAAPDAGASPSPAPRVVANAAASPSPSPSVAPSPSPSASPAPTPTPDPSPTPTPDPSSPPAAMNLYAAAGFRYQDPNYVACTAASVMDMLNFVVLNQSGGDGFRWRLNRTGTTRDAILSWERHHDTLIAAAKGTDPHGWRNALNYYGWGSGALYQGTMVYDDVAYSSYDAAMHMAVRQIILTRKPVGLLGWSGHHAQMVTGYYGLAGDPFEKNADGTWTDLFTVTGFYVSDPLRSDSILNRKVSYAALATTSNLRLRYRTYVQTDSPYDDRYEPGYRSSRSEWYGKFTLLLPLR